MAPLSPFDRDEYAAAHPVDHDRRACLRLAVLLSAITLALLLAAVGVSAFVDALREGW